MQSGQPQNANLRHRYETARNHASLARNRHLNYTSLQDFLSCMNAMERVLIIADDLTGALDSGCAFAGRGLVTRVALNVSDLAQTLADNSAQVVAVVSASRELSAARAAQISLEICDAMQAFDGIVLKKIDSRLKGNIAAELAPLARRVGRPILACPAIPAQGRFTQDGKVIGAGVASPIAIVPILGLPAALPDCHTDDDLDRALPADLRENLYVGAAGLAAALARRLAPEGTAAPLPLPRPLLLAIGSRDPITLAQIAAASLPVHAAPNGAVPGLPAAPAVLVQLTAGAQTVDGLSAATDFATGIARQIDRLAPKSLFACGGETAHAILRELGCAALTLCGEVLPGVPVAYCPARNLVVLTKSGGFGTTNLLNDLLSEFDKSIAERITTF